MKITKIGKKEVYKKLRKNDHRKKRVDHYWNFKV